MIKNSVPFNSPLETGIRSLHILVAAFPTAFDLERLVELDYLVVHSADVGGPSSLHAPLPLRTGELLVRRDLVEKGLLLMISRDLVSRTANKTGFHYLATDAGYPFLSLLSSTYSQELKQRAEWAVERFANESTANIRHLTHASFTAWASQFEGPKALEDSDE